MPGAGLGELATLAEAHDEVEGMTHGAGGLAAIDRGVVRPLPGPGRLVGAAGHVGAQRQSLEVVDVESLRGVGRGQVAVGVAPGLSGDRVAPRLE